MKILKNGCLLSVLLLLLAGPSWAQNEAGSAEPEIVITNASMIAPTPEKENLNQEWVEITNLRRSPMPGWVDAFRPAESHLHFPGFHFRAWSIG
jgi:hypothetical protein